MSDHKTSAYTAKPSDSREWIIIESPAGKAIDVQLRVMDYRYDCIPQIIDVGNEKIYCSNLCCYQGCYVSPKEVEYVAKHLKDIKPMLREDSLRVLEMCQDKIYVPEDYDAKENLFKTCCAPREWTNDELCVEHEDKEAEAPPANHCIFLMHNGLCSVHKFCSDRNINWVKNKFNICVTFPLDIRPQDKTLAFMDGFDQFTFGKVDCISPDENRKKQLGMPQVIESMKYAIVDRYGEEWWAALNAFAIDYRNGKIDLDSIYKEFDEEK